MGFYESKRYKEHKLVPKRYLASLAIEKYELKSGRDTTLYLLK
jgi:hypothetical protein